MRQKAQRLQALTSCVNGGGTPFLVLSNGGGTPFLVLSNGGGTPFWVLHASALIAENRDTPEISVSIACDCVPHRDRPKVLARTKRDCNRATIRDNP